MQFSPLPLACVVAVAVLEKPERLPAVSTARAV
jgi:hypothetical protein